MNVLTNSLGRPRYTNSIDSFRYFQVMSNELSNPALLTCPADKNHGLATNFTSDFNGSRISYFVGLEADKKFPNALLAGDYNITNELPLKSDVMELSPKSFIGWTTEVHYEGGNAGLADGSVQQFTSFSLQKFLQESSLTNRLLLPP